MFSVSFSLSQHVLTPLRSFGMALVSLPNWGIPSEISHYPSRRSKVDRASVHVLLLKQ
jgi:hypothetical protein